MNKTKPEKHDIGSNTIEKKSIEDENYKEIYNFDRLIKVKEDVEDIDVERREISDIKIDSRKKK